MQIHNYISPIAKWCSIFAAVTAVSGSTARRVAAARRLANRNYLHANFSLHIHMKYFLATLTFLYTAYQMDPFGI